MGDVIDRVLGDHAVRPFGLVDAGGGRAAAADHHVADRADPSFCGDHDVDLGRLVPHEAPHVPGARAPEC